MDCLLFISRCLLALCRVVKLYFTIFLAIAGVCWSFLMKFQNSNIKFGFCTGAS